MRPAVRAAVAIGVLVVAACTLYALHFAMQTNERLGRLEEYIDGRTEVRNSQYDQQEREIDELRARLCLLDPTVCDA